MPNGHALRHLNKRRPWASAFDRFMYLVAFAYPLSTVPQIIQIFLKKTAEGVSPLTLLLYLFFAICWIVYGLIHREAPIVISNALWVIMYFGVLGGVMIY